MEPSWYTVGSIFTIVCVNMFVLCLCVCVLCLCDGSPPLAMPAPPVLMLSQHVVGSGHEWGAIAVEFTNHAPQVIEVLYLEMVPWFFRLYLHTLSISGGIQEERQKQCSSEVVIVYHN